MSEMIVPKNLDQLWLNNLKMIIPDVTYNAQATSRQFALIRQTSPDLKKIFCRKENWGSARCAVKNCAICTQPLAKYDNDHQLALYMDDNNCDFIQRNRTKKRNDTSAVIRNDLKNFESPKNIDTPDFHIDLNGLLLYSFITRTSIEKFIVLENGYTFNDNNHIIEYRHKGEKVISFEEYNTAIHPPLMPNPTVIDTDEGITYIKSKIYDAAKTCERIETLQRSNPIIIKYTCRKNKLLKVLTIGQPLNCDTICEKCEKGYRDYYLANPDNGFDQYAPGPNQIANCFNSITADQVKLIKSDNPRDHDILHRLLRYAFLSQVPLSKIIALKDPYYFNNEGCVLRKLTDNYPRFHPHIQK